ncbi:hypothetical protein DLV06_16530 [Shigella flexneri]|nr:hypothetical protein [Shigella flexneri]EGD9623772.1 hypothetical protein [Shigella flexneri]
MALNLDTLGLSATVTAQGISAPDYQTILDTLTSYFRQIYGSDAYLEPDSKDGQMVALVALAVHDANNTAIGIYNSFSPTTAQAAALSSNVKINGITRKVATNSTADLLLTGTAGTTITNGSARDKNGIIWNFPASVAIGVDGTVLVTATCANSGSVAATVGSPAETDAELRIRQGQSVALPSITPFEGVDGAIANVAGVTRHKLYENDTGATDSNGLPPHSISAIVDGGDVTEIAQTIRGSKGQGTATYGKTSVTVPDTYGNPHVISFSRSTDVPIFVAITLKVFTGYTSQIGEQIKQAVADYINGLTIGDDVLLSRIYSPANLGVVSGGNARYYDITDLLIGKSSGSVSASNIDIAYDASASCSTANISITVTS